MSVKSALRFAALFASVGALAGCAVAPPGNPSASPAATAPQDRPAPTAVPTPAPVPSSMPAPPPAVPAAPVSQAQQQQAHKIALAAVDALEAGNEEQAKAELGSALAVDPNSKLAQNLLKQISADPFEALGRDSFAYTVRSSDTLSRIAGRFLGDIFSFYILARYNDIKVPRQVAAGQVLRIPGKAPPAGSDRDPPPVRPAQVAIPAPAPVQAAPTAAAVPPPPAAAPALAEPPAGVKAMRSAEAAENAGDLGRALSEYNRAATLDQPQAASKAAAVRRKMVANHTQAARAAMARQDLDGSIGSWDRVLEIEPSNDTARLERQRAITLRDRLKGMNK